MTTLKCDECGYVGHKADWHTFRGRKRQECPECHSGRGAAYVVD